MLRLQVTKRIQFDLRLLAEAEVMLDRHRMDQVISSLLVNARNAMGRNGQIIVTVSEGSPSQLEEQMPDVEWICISIEDSGPGIPAELRERIFEPFFSTKRNSISTGLGLSVANKIVKLHNGILQAGDSEELGGAAMRIYLPKAE